MLQSLVLVLYTMQRMHKAFRFIFHFWDFVWKRPLRCRRWGERATFCDVEDVTTASITLLFQDRLVYTPLDRFRSGLCSARQDTAFHSVIVLTSSAFMYVTVQLKVKRSNLK
jgi:hypothetical protein